MRDDFQAGAHSTALAPAANAGRPAVARDQVLQSLRPDLGPRIQHRGSAPATSHGPPITNHQNRDHRPTNRDFCPRPEGS